MIHVYGTGTGLAFLKVDAVQWKTAVIRKITAVTATKPQDGSAHGNIRYDRFLVEAVKPSCSHTQGKLEMAYNLFIAYDLIPPGQNYEAVHDAIKSLGKWHQFQYSFWYVHTELSPAEAFAIVGAVTDSRDKLAVINAQSGIVTNWDHPPIDAINAIWLSP